jgi:hypothetical protein
MENRTNLTDENGSDVSINTNTNLLEDRNMEESKMWELEREMKTDQLRRDFANKLGVEADKLDDHTLECFYMYMHYNKITDIKTLYEKIREEAALKKLLDDLDSCEKKIIKNAERFRKIGLGRFAIENIAKKYLREEDLNLETLSKRFKEETYVSDFDMDSKFDFEDMVEIVKRIPF